MCCDSLGGDWAAWSLRELHAQKQTALTGVATTKCAETPGVNGQQVDTATSATLPVDPMLLRLARLVKLFRLVRLIRPFLSTVEYFPLVLELSAQEGERLRFALHHGPGLGLP